MIEKARIRGRRNKEAERQKPMSQRKIESVEIGVMDKEAIRTKMSQTTTDWLGKTRKGFRTDEMSFGVTKREEMESEEVGKLEEWQRRTCRAKWCYKVDREDIENEEK